MDNILEGKHIAVGVTGGIAAYKAVELVRILVKQKASVKVFMTESARKFVNSRTFSVISGQSVCSSLFNDSDSEIRHISWAEEADAVVIAPATANMIGKLAGGIADDALSTFITAVTSPVIICPSMNTHMYENRIVQRNIDTLEKVGCHILEPGSGELACGTTGAGRLPEPSYIADRVKQILYKKDLLGKKILVTAGPTREAPDPVRFISNHSSGKMGFEIARAAEYRGADVVLVSGPVSLKKPNGVTVIDVISTQDMADTVFQNINQSDIIIKVAAVSDYRPENISLHKIKKNDETFSMDLVKNQDILMEAGKRKKNQILVGFAAETQELKDNALKKLKKKNLDLIAANIVGKKDSGFGSDTNAITLYSKDGTEEPLPLMTKSDLSHILLDRISAMDLES